MWNAFRNKVGDHDRANPLAGALAGVTEPARSCAFPRLRLDGSGDREMPEQRSVWSREFDEPIAVPGGGALVTLSDAADYITALPDDEAALPEWQARSRRADTGGRAGWPNHVRPDWSHARIEPTSR